MGLRRTGEVRIISGAQERAEGIRKIHGNSLLWMGFRACIAQAHDLPGGPLLYSGERSGAGLAQVTLDPETAEKSPTRNGGYRDEP